jgi:hypothetical protein
MVDLAALLVSFLELPLATADVANLVGVCPVFGDKGFPCEGHRDFPLSPAPHPGLLFGVSPALPTGL